LFLLSDDVKEFLLAAGVTPCSNCINLTYDSKGYYYEIPNYCINNPHTFEIPTNEVKKLKPPENVINVKVRKVIDEKIYSISNYNLIKDLKEAVATSFFEQPFESNKVRLFYGGKDLCDSEEVWTYNIENGSIILLLIRESN
jgi:hypothetical protein